MTKHKQANSLNQRAANLRAKGVLNDKQIAHLAKKHGMISPFVDHKVDGDGILSYGLEPFGYTMTIADKPYTRFAHTGTPITAGTDKQEEITERPHTDKASGKKCVQVPPNDVILVVGAERLKMPVDVQGQFLIKSSLARYGLFGNVTWIDAGWEGWLTIEIANLGRNPINVPVGEGVGQIVFYRGYKPSIAYRGRYQNQSGLPQQAIT